MTKKIGYHIKIEDLFKALNIGKVIKSPKTVSGGLLHKSFEVESEGGHFFVKALNPHIMIRPRAMNHYTFSDKVSKIALKSGISACVPLSFSNQTIHCYDGQYYQVFPWINGLTQCPDGKKERVSHKIGRLLGQLHRVDFSHMEDLNMEEEAYVQVDWQKIIKQGIYEDLKVKLQQTVDFNFLDQIQARTFKGHQALKKMIISHRDLDPKNVMWTDDKEPIIVDWEAAGYVNPTFELLEVALYWSENKDASIDSNAFISFIEGYKSVCDIDYKEMVHVWDAIHMNKLGWIEYNLKKVLGIESNSYQESILAYDQVMDTLKSIKSFEDTMILLKSMMNDRQ